MPQFSTLCTTIPWEKIICKQTLFSTSIVNQQGTVNNTVLLHALQVTTSQHLYYIQIHISI